MITYEGIKPIAKYYQLTILNLGNLNLKIDYCNLIFDQTLIFIGKKLKTLKELGLRNHFEKSSIYNKGIVYLKMLKSL